MRAIFPSQNQQNVTCINTIKQRKSNLKLAISLNLWFFRVCFPIPSDRMNTLINQKMYFGCQSEAVLQISTENHFKIDGKKHSFICAIRFVASQCNWLQSISSHLSGLNGLLIAKKEWKKFIYERFYEIAALARIPFSMKK